MTEKKEHYASALITINNCIDIANSAVDKQDALKRLRAFKIRLRKKWEAEGKL